MPYITQEKREVLDPAIDRLAMALVDLQNGAAGEKDNMEGNINYVVSTLLANFYNNNYADINNAVGLLNCIALEYYVRLAVPYEAQKAFENGDVYS